MAWVTSTAGLQPAMVPSRVANRRVLGADTPFAEMTNPVVPLKTTPVGVPGPPRVPADGGTLMTSGVPDGRARPAPEYRGTLPEPALARANGPAGPSVRPQGLTTL